ncbi:MAG: electron transfer flavoprotein-ubiquinone oxidoreductase [Alphaproteobacteria bacterium]|nr:electron transfer flavoprotein-ubiquinone oxidoreductase [Alphaproteobacteria bacterium SS10]
MERESMEFDVVVVGAGPAGLATAIRLKQRADEAGQELAICVIEKGSEVGAHLLSGAVFETRALDELIPDWKDKGAPLTVEAKEDSFMFLTKKSAFKMPTPPQMHNKGNYVISLGELARWLAEQAEAIGVEIYPGFAAAEVLYDDQGQVMGVATGDMGIGKDGEQTANYTPGMELHAKQTVFSEGCRGSLTKTLFEKFDLRKDSDPQTYSIGIKELWEIDPEKHKPGKIVHTIGWPMDNKTYGGSWLYHFKDNLVSVGYVIGLDYQNPYLSPFDEMQRFKTHPSIAPLFEGARRVSYGARALSAGGYQSLPKLTFPGGVLVGDTAGFLNVPKIKGNHTAMKSGMTAADAIFEHLKAEKGREECTAYPEMLKKTWLWDELYRVRNIKPSFHWGLWPAIIYSAIDTYIFRGKAPWTLKNHADHKQLKPAAECEKIEYPKPDGKLTFDKLSSVFISDTNHEENQPAHLKLKDESIPIAHNLPLYDEPAQRYCPAGVYEVVREEGEEPRFQINAQNCVHCKTCDIKDPSQNINWTVPEGAGGPNYAMM